MLSSIVKFSKSLSIKILVGIIILPFVFWGMGDIFRGGNQNIIATIDSEKVSVQNFFNYLNKLNLTEKEREDLKKTNLMERIISEYIGKKIINLEVDDLGIVLSDASLKEIIVNDKTFFKNKKFSRTEYEKFLIKSGVTAPAFEKNLYEQEKRRQLLSFLSKGVSVPDFLIENTFNEENQIKSLIYLDLSNYYNKIKIKEEELEKKYSENKDFFLEEYKSISFSELSPEILIGQKEYNETYFNKIDSIENDILDGKKIEDLAKENSLRLIKTDEINSQKKSILGIESKIINDKLFDIIFKNKNTNSPELINIENKYYVAEITSVNKINRDIKDKKVVELISGQIKFENIIKNNTEIAKKISSGFFNKSELEKYAKEKSLEIKSTTINGLKDNKVFKENIIKRIFKTKNNKINLISNNSLSENFLVYIVETKNIKLDKNSENYKKYKSKTKLKLANNIYRAYDKSVNAKYKIDLNDKVVKRVKNSF